MQAYKNKNVKITRRFWLLQSQATTTVIGFSVIGVMNGSDFECVTKAKFGASSFRKTESTAKRTF